jgi:hypothetical protein
LPAVLPITYLLLALPVALFMAGWFRLPLAIGGIVVLLCSLRGAWHADGVPLPRLPWASRFLALAVSLFWLSVSGAGGIGWQQSDWLKHNVVLADLIRGSWPVVYADGRPLVYYLAYYLTPALFGKIGGWQVAYAVLGVQTWALYFLAAAWILKLLGERGRLGLIVFCLFSGLDVVGNWYATGAWGHDPWWSRLQYSNPALLVMFVPQHVIIGWLGTVLVLESDRRAKPELAVLTGVVALCWSPFVTLGLAPFILWTWLVHRGWQRRIGLQAAAVLAVFLPIGIFFQSRAHIEVVSWLDMGIPYTTFIVFMLLDWGLFALLLGITEGRALIARPSLLLAMLCLAVIPFIPFRGYTDFVMRSSIPALFILALQTITAAVTTRERCAFAVAGLWGALLIGALQPLGLYRQSIAHLEYNVPPMELVPTLPGMSAYTGHPGDGRQYFGRVETAYMLHLAPLRPGEINAAAASAASEGSDPGGICHDSGEGVPLNCP